VKSWKKITSEGLHPSSVRWATDRNLPDENEIAICAEWIRLFCLPSVALYRKSTSYGLKHVVERWAHKIRGEHQHICNGAFIEAARRGGYRVERADDAPGSLNAFFNMKFSKAAFPKPEAPKPRPWM
jgi:hypothetical protein